MNFNHKTYHIQQPAQRRQGQYGDVAERPSRGEYSCCHRALLDAAGELARMAANQRRSRTGRAACHRTGPASVGRPFVSLSIHHTLPSAFSSIAGQNLNPMPQRLNNNLQALPDSLRAPRQINDQRSLPDPSRSPAQHRPLRDRQTKRPHRLRNPRHTPLDHILRSLRRHIPLRKPGTTRSQDQLRKPQICRSQPSGSPSIPRSSGKTSTETTSYPAASIISFTAGPLRSSRSPLYPLSLEVITATLFITQPPI